MNAKVTAIDVCKENVVAAKEMSEKLNLSHSIDYHHKGIEDVEKENQKFDVVCAFEVIEHVENQLPFIESMTKCMKRNSLLFISTIHPSPIAKFAAVTLAENILSIVPKGTHNPDKFISSEAIANHLNSASCDCRVLATESMGLTPLTPNGWQWKWTNSPFQAMNYIIAAIKL